MSNIVKFIHTADLHLGANPFKTEERYNDMFRAFENLVINAINESIRYILISGDMFHTKDVDAETYTKTIKILDLAKENNIEVICIEGNHDMRAYNKNISWLEQLSKDNKIMLLKPTRLKNGERKLEIGKSIYITDKMAIIGLGYPQSTAINYINSVVEQLENLKEELKDKNIICMLHTGIDRYVTEAMGGIRKNDISNLLDLVDYLALGHIHEAYEKEGKIYMPGSLENVSNINKEEDKGYYVVKIEDKKVFANFTKLEIRKSYRLNIKISEDIEDIEEYVFSKMKEENINKESILQLNINGKNKTTIINTKKLEKQLKESLELIYVKVINNIVSIENSNKAAEYIHMTREEIENKVKRDLLSEKGYDENLEETLEILEFIKDTDVSKITLDTDVGKELLEKMINVLDLEIEEIGEIK